MAKKGRPFVYQSEDEKPITVSLRLPRDLHEQAQRYVNMRRPMTLTDLLLDGLRLRLETPADPRDIILSDDNTVIQELQEMVDTAVQAALAKLSSTVASAPEAPAEPVPDIAHDDNTVLQEKVSQPQGGRGVKRQRILALLYEHQEGLSAEQIRGHLSPGEPLGDTLQGMRRQGVVKTQGNGRHMRYFVA